jgi:membrane-associated protein
MEIIHYLLSFMLHLDQHLVTFVSQYGAWSYAILFLIIFCETGLVVFAFLPGDSLLFAAGALAAKAGDALNIHFLFILLVSASILGNTLNYLIGKFIGPKIFRSPDSWLLNKKYLTRAHEFYEQYGSKAIIIARFIPIIRTFAPFVAGIGYMSYRRFSFFNITGALLWIGSLLYTSFLFGNLPLIRDHFSTIILAIIVISLMPIAIGVLHRSYFKQSPKIC